MSREEPEEEQLRLPIIYAPRSKRSDWHIFMAIPSFQVLCGRPEDLSDIEMTFWGSLSIAWRGHSIDSKLSLWLISVDILQMKDGWKPRGRRRIWNKVDKKEDNTNWQVEQCLFYVKMKTQKWSSSQKMKKNNNNHTIQEIRGEERLLLCKTVCWTQKKKP